MKLQRSNYFRSIIYAIFGFFVVFACQKINPFEDTDLTVNTDIYKAPILLRFVDGNEESTKIPEGLTVSISGPNKDLVLDDTGGKDYTVIGNVLPLVLNKDINPSETNPIKFTVAVSGTGYVSTSKNITVVSADSTLEFEIPLTSVTNPPKGAATATQVMSLTNGETITVPTTADKAEIAQITIAPGTQVKDATGNVINATTVKAQVVQYGTQSEEALNSFPGGFDSENVSMQDGTSTSGSFVTAGFVAVDMEADGKKVTEFSKPIDVKVGVSAELENPETGQKIQEGDKIPTWSYESATGQWKEEGEAIITKGSDGKLAATFKASHLSYWNIDWYYWLPRCKYSFNIETSSSITNNIGESNYLVRVYSSLSKYNYLYYRLQKVGFNVKNGSVNTFSGLYTPNGSRVLIYVFNRSTNRLVGSTAVFNPCQSGNIPIRINDPSVVPSINLDIDFTAKCTNKSVNIKPSTWIDFYDTVDRRWSWTYSRSGKASITLKEGREYIFYTYYNRKYYSGRVTFGKNSSSIITSGGLGITGTTSYNASTGRVKVLASYNINNCK